MPATPARSRLSTLATPRALLVAGLLAFLVSALAQALTLPAFEGPDEQRHYAYARYLVNTRALPPIARRPDDGSGSTYGINQMSGNPPLYYGLVALATAWVPDADAVGPFMQVNPFSIAYDLAGIDNDNHATYLRGPEDAFPWRGPALAVRAGRVLSALLGLITVAAAAGIAGELAPRLKWAPGLTAVMLAALPQFVYLHGAITTDVGVNAFSALAMLCALRMARRGPTLRMAVLGGLAAAGALLCKVNGAWVAVVVWAGILLGPRLRAEPGRRFDARPLVASMLVWFVIGGWWPLRGLIERGDPFGVAVHSYDAGAGLSFAFAPGVLENLPVMLGDLEQSLWFAPGFAPYVPGPAWLFVTWRILFGGGLILALIALARRRTGPIQRAQLVLLGMAAVFGLAGIAYWMLVYKWSLGRLLYPTLTSFMAVSAVGWAWLFGRIPALAAGGRAISGQGIAFGAWAAMLARCGAGGLLTTYMALHPHPAIRALRPDDQPTAITFLDPRDQRTEVASLVAFHVPPQDARAGDVARLELCWKSGPGHATSYPYAAQLVGPNDARPATRLSYHGLGTFPMKAWADDQVFCDPVTMRINADVEHTRAYQLLVTLIDYDPADVTVNRPLPARDGQGRPVEHPVIGRMRVAAAAPPPALPVVAVFDGLAGLAAPDVSRPRPDEITLGLRWMAQRDGARDAKVFVHALDAAGAIVAQADYVPDAGWFPTRYWRRGDVISETVTLKLPAGGASELRIGLYDSATVARWPAAASDGQRLADDSLSVPLARRDQRASGRASWPGVLGFNFNSHVLCTHYLHDEDSLHELQLRPTDRPPQLQQHQVASLCARHPSDVGRRHGFPLA